MAKILTKAELSQDEHAWLSRRAEETGLWQSDVIRALVAQAAGLPIPPRVIFLFALAHLVTATWGGKPFPVDVTLCVARDLVLQNAKMRPLYNAAVTGPTGSVDPHLRHVVHRSLGALVRGALKAKVIGRSTPVDPTTNLIETYSLLAPS